MKRITIVAGFFLLSFLFSPNLSAAAEKNRSLMGSTLLKGSPCAQIVIRQEMRKVSLLKKSGWREV
ncbi:hypothetical protein HUU62_27090 [Rhodoferax sp. 4810]|nr:hypothetical protein [Rhodoferax jenense]